MRNIVHSFWSVPALKNRMGVDNKLQMIVNVYCNAVSFAYAKAFNQRMVFYGDPYSLEMFSIIPYDETHSITPINEQKSFCWAQGKFSALKQMQLGDVHIDGDVFIKSKKCWDVVESDWDIIIQSVEEPQLGNKYYDYVRDTIQGFEFLNNCKSLVGNAYNCGVIGINNQKFKDTYIETYVDAVKQTPMLTEEQAMKIWPDLIYEQQFLYQLCQQNPHLRVCNILGTKTKEIYKKSLELDYQHVLGADKYTKFEFIRQELDYIDKSMRIKLDNTYGINDETFNIPETQIDTVILRCDDEDECDAVFSYCVQNGMPEKIFNKKLNQRDEWILEMKDSSYLKHYKLLLSTYYDAKIAKYREEHPEDEDDIEDAEIIE